MKLGKVLSAYRYRRELSYNRPAHQDDMAKEIGISPATLSRLESGKSVNGETMIKVMQWLFSA